MVHRRQRERVSPESFYYCKQYQIEVRVLLNLDIYDTVTQFLAVLQGGTNGGQRLVFWNF
jgi:hypothetical protein